MKYLNIFFLLFKTTCSHGCKGFNNNIKKNKMILNTHSFVVLIIICLALGITIKSAMSRNIYNGLEIGTEGEVPTLLMYGDKIPGFSSNTLYIGIPMGRDESSPHSLILSFNATVYGIAEITTDQGSTRSYAYTMGWWPANPIVWLIAADGSDDDFISLLSPAVGYSYILYQSNDFELSGRASAGLAYGRINKPDMDAFENNEGDNIKKLESYEEMKSIEKKYGCRLNTRIKFTRISSSFRYGICAGYTHYIFNQINFNSIDIGTFVSFMF